MCTAAVQWFWHIACSENASQGLFIVGFVEGGLAELDGRLQKNDRILSIENHDLANGTQEEAANIIRVGCICVCVLAACLGGCPACV